MSEPVIEPSAVYSPRAPIATGRQRFYETYNTREMGGPPAGAPADTPVGGDDPGGGSRGVLFKRAYNAYTNLPPAQRTRQPVSIPKGLPKFLGNRQTLFFAWIVAMLMVTLDEWHTFGILPRPARLWSTSWFFMILGLVSIPDAFVPIVNMFALGMIIVLGYQYYQGTGQFGGYGAQEAAGGSPAPPTGTSPVTSGIPTAQGTGQ